MIESMKELVEKHCDREVFCQYHDWTAGDDEDRCLACLQLEAKERRELLEPLKEVIRAAYTAATTGDTVSRAYRVQMIIEESGVLEDD